MPRKQRFKPSRKPKPIPTPAPQTDGGGPIDQSTAQRDDVPRSPEHEAPRPPPEVRADPRTGDGEARPA